MVSSSKEMVNWHDWFPSYNGDKGTDPNGDIAWWDFMRKRSWAAQDAINSMPRVLNPAIMHGMTTDWQGHAIQPTARSFSGGLGSGLPNFIGGSTAAPPSAGTGPMPAGGLPAPAAPAAPAIAPPQGTGAFPGPPGGQIIGQPPAINQSLIQQLMGFPGPPGGVIQGQQPAIDQSLIQRLMAGG